MLILFLIMMAVNTQSFIVCILFITSFIAILSIAYFIAFTPSPQSILDLYLWSSLYGASMSIIVWIFAWLLALTNNVLIGPFIFKHSTFSANSSAYSILFGCVASILYGGIIPFFLLWLKCDKRCCDPCSAKCRILNFNLMNGQKEIKQVNEQMIISQMETAMRRLNMECIVCMAAYVGTIYMLSFVFMFNRLDVIDSAYIAVLGYFGKDFIFFMLF